MLVPLAQPVLAKPKPKPDLVVSSAQLMSDPWVLQEAGESIWFTDKTKNAGRATAGRSRTGIFLVEQPGAERGYPGPKRRMPKLKKGESNKGSVSSARPDFSRVPLGSYFVQVCADPPDPLGEDEVNESDEGNNCKLLGERLTVIPRRWTGTVQGTDNFTGQVGIRESWSGEVTFAFDKGLSSPGTVIYEPTDGTVSYEISGTGDNGCTYSGNGTYSGALVGGLQINDYFTSYNATAAAPYEWGYDGTVGGGESCSGSFRGPFIGSLTTGPKPITPKFGITALAGQYLAPFGLDAKWEWNLIPPSP